MHHGCGLNVLKSMEIRFGHSEMSIISQMSAVEGCLLSGVPLYYYDCHSIQYVCMHTCTVSILNAFMKFQTCPYKRKCPADQFTYFMGGMYITEVLRDYTIVAVNFLRC